MIVVRIIKFLGHAGLLVGTALVYVIKPIIYFLFRVIVVNPYQLILKAHYSGIKLRSLITPTHWLSHHRGIIYLITITAVAIMGHSWRTRHVNAEDFGQHNLLFPLIQDEYDITITEESTFLTEPDQPTTVVITPNDSERIILDPGDAPIILTQNGTAILKPMIVTTQPGVAGRTRIEQYMVRSGDTLLGIAERFGINLTTLLWENRLTERSLLRIGQNITILPTNGVSYRVGRGDTVAKIAQKFRTSERDIINFNQISGPLTIGQTLVLPGGRPLATTPAPRPQSPTPREPALPRESIAPPTRTATKLQWPTVRRRITQYFTWRHTGVDIGDAIGTSLYAAEDGIVEVAGWNRGGYGYYLIVDHGGGLKTLYGHSSKLLVRVGDRVERGQEIALMGSTGRSTGSHLHFEVRVNGRRVNPLRYTR